MAEGRGEAAFPEAPGNETEGWPRCRLLRRGPPPAAGPGPAAPSRGAPCIARALALGGVSEKKRTRAPSPGPGARCPPSAGEGKRGGRDAAAIREQTISQLPCAKQPLPNILSPAAFGRKWVFPPSGERCTIKPTPRVYISNFFLSRLHILRACST